jgi:YVTN family beta-propeller protein
MFQATLLLLLAQTVDQPARAVTDPGVVTTRQAITPAGVPSIFQGRVYGLAFGKDGELWVLGGSHLYQLDWRANRVIQKIAHGGSPALQGLRFENEPRYAVTRKQAVQFNQLTLGQHLAGALAAAGGKTAIPLTFNNELALIEDGKVAGRVKTGIAPFGAAMNRAGTVAYVTNWGGRFSKPGERTQKAGLEPQADDVLVDARGVAASGTVTRIDLQSLTVTHTIPVGLHPMAIEWDESSGQIYVANGNSDTISVIDSRTQQVTSTIAVQPFTSPVKGIAPTALALVGGKLFVACGGINAVVQIDRATRRIEGAIPTAWYPNALTVSTDGKQLAVASLLGAGSGWREEPKKRYVHAYRGAVAVIDLPDPAQLASYTAAVGENNRVPLLTPLSPRKVAAKAIPERAGEPSLIEHVVFIIKENRTYDQLFGDLGKGNGDPALVMFGEDVTPNQRRMAEQFVLLDNFYATGGNSADGHQWLTQSNEMAYTLWPGYAGRSYPFDGTDPLAHAEGGFLWDAALKAKKTVRVYGEYAGRLAEPIALRHELLDGWRRGEKYFNRWSMTAPLTPLNPILARNYPTYTNSIPDLVRADIFLEDVRGWEAKPGSMPNLVILQLPSDHTFGTTPGASTPKAMVADNDWALGRIVEALSKTRYWPKMAIFITEDDAQNGVDHVDGHRTVSFAVSPYVRRGHVDSTFYSHQSMMKTIELILGLPALSLFDMIALDMRASFTDTPDLSPFTAVEPKQDLFEKNPPVSALRGQDRRDALDSARMRWDVPDAAPTGRLNRILWRNTKGASTPFPGVRNAVFAPLSIELDDDERDSDDR